MKNQIRKMTGGILVAGILVTGLSTGVTAFAANTNIGAAGAAADTTYTLEDMLVYAIEDEYLAQAEYNIIMDTYGVQTPFSNIIRAEGTHISLLAPLFEEYGITIPEQNWESLVVVPETLDSAYAIGVEAEKKNIAMYEAFLKENLPDDVREVFVDLMTASQKHLTSFQRQVDGIKGGNGFGAGNGIGNGTGNGIGNGTGNAIGNSTDNCTESGIESHVGKGNSGIGGNGQGNRSSSHTH